MPLTEAPWSFQVWTVTEDGLKDKLHGGAKSVDHAVTLAAAWLAARQIIKPDTSVTVGVFDEATQTWVAELK
jgi:hypothetical protein